MTANKTLRRPLAVLLLVLCMLCSRASAAAFTDSTGVTDPAGGNAPPAATEIRIRDGLRHESLKQILAGIKKLQEGRVGEIVRKFAGADSNWVWVVREATLPRHVNAVTDPMPIGAVTTLNYSNLKGATRLSVARTLIHELVHAYLLLHFRYEGLEAIEAYPRMAAAYRAVVPAPNLNEVHHREMAVSFVNEIAIALREYGRGIGLKVDDSVYWDMAWGGLDFPKNNQLAEENKVRIQQRLHVEQFGIPVYSMYPVGPQMGE